MNPLSPDLVAALQPHFRGQIRTDRATRTLYATDASIYQQDPLGVAIPTNQDDLQAAVEFAARHRIPILPRGSGSSLAGQAIGNALILDVSRYLDTILEINPEAQTATVEPGVILAHLNRAAARHGLQFGPDPASAERATLGGVIGNNATGAHSILYGMSADHLLAADVLMWDGSPARWGELNPSALPQTGVFGGFAQDTLEIRRRYEQAIRAGWVKSWRNSAGYRLNYLLPFSPTRPPQWVGAHYPANLPPGAFNLAPLLAGSEGTLAVFQRLTLRLVRKPAHSVLIVLPYPSIAAAADDVPRLLETSPSAVELIPQMLIDLARQVPAYAAQMDFVQGSPAALLVVEYSGADPALLRKQALALGKDLYLAENASAQARIWNVRKVGLGIFDSRPAETRPVAFIEDCAIPAERLGDFVRGVEQILKQRQTTAAFYAHASAGCLHIRPLLNLHTSAGKNDLRAIAEQTLALTLRLGGAMSSEHGDGIARSEWMERTYGVELMQAFAALKHAADPHNLLNPGKILQAPRMDTHLRYDPPYQPQAWQPVLDFSNQGGLTAAIEQCNGQGVCRKSGGVMCPSFQASREEKHSTRGRANLLRAFITSSRLAPPNATLQDVREALDLCLACKGCKSECPSRVDMAKLKYEFQNFYYRNHPRPLRDYLFGYINQLAPLGAPFGAVINLLSSQALTRRLVSLLGIEARRALPRYAPPVPTSRARTSAAPAVILLPDTFTRYFEPEIEASARQVLAACHITPLSLPLLGAGRTLLSKGFLQAARAHLSRLLDEIQRLDPAGSLPVIGIEPSEIYTLRDELQDLLPQRRAETQALAARSWLMEEYLIRPAPGENQPRLAALASPKSATVSSELRFQNPLPKSVSLHGHCYQKAQPPAADGYPVGQEASAALLRLLGYEVEIIPSGCCGMAGAFGYEKEHYHLSMQVGEQILFPHLRHAQALNPALQVAAPGTSCRSQIADGVAMQAQHPIVLAAACLLRAVE